MGIYEFAPEDATRFAQERGVRIREQGNELQFYTCPYCHGGEHGDKWTFAINQKTGAFNCKRGSCGVKGNMLTLHKDFGFSLGRDVDEYYGRTRRFRYIHRAEKPKSHDKAVEYLKSRSISEKVCREYNITVQAKNENILVFPFYDDDGIMRFVKYRKTDFDPAKDKNKEWCEANCEPILFGMNHVNLENETLVLTEGQIDSLSVAEAGVENAVSVPTGKLGFTWVPYCWDFLGKFNTLIVFGDYENGEISLLDEMQRRFHGLVKHVRSEDYRGCKDANDILRKYGPEAVRTAVLNAVPIKISAIKDLTEFERKDLSKLARIPTGVGGLDKILNGFYLGTLVILTGPRGEGKSTMGSQFGTFAVKAGYSVFFYSGELEGFMFRDWIERQIAGPNNINRMVDGSNGYVSYSVDGSRIREIETWYQGKIELFDNEATLEDESITILQMVDAAVKQYGCQMIVIDNLMTAIDDDMSSDLYRQQTAFVRELAKKAKMYNVVILLVAHPRKRNGEYIDNDDVMGSSNITNLADVVLSYSKERGEGIPDDTPDRRLRVLKNRMNGWTSRSGTLLHFDEPSKRIYEDGKAPDWLLGWEQTKFEPVSPEEELPFV